MLEKFQKRRLLGHWYGPEEFSLVVDGVNTVEFGSAQSHKVFEGKSYGVNKVVTAIASWVCACSMYRSRYLVGPISGGEVSKLAGGGGRCDRIASRERESRDE